MITRHVIDKFDEALINGWIKVYYQPVIRSLTGELCGFESLARWVDPELGILSPDSFITPLEEQKLIYKLDCYMVDRVCRDIHDRFEADLEMVPVSINFSKLDFIMCDMLDVVETAVEKYDIPHDYLHIEITESIMVSEGDMMRDIIDGFRAKGYGVWLDDFGSGFSSLNLLKDYNFDVLKMDMTFLSSFTVKSKAIMKSVITMAKDIGLMTLAEGVETEDEVDFLKEMGCGRLQGYYYGKPMPLEEAISNLDAKGIKMEGRKWHHFYDAAVSHARSTDAPLEIVEYDGKDYRTLFMNDVYKMQIFDDLPSLEEADRRIYHTESPLLEKYQTFVNQLSKTKRTETFYYTANSNYLCFKAREIANHEGKMLIKGSIMNISMEQNSAKQTELDYRLRELNHLFAVVLLFNPSEETVKPIIGKFRFYDGPEKMNMRQSTMMMANAAIHPADRARYLEFMNSDTFAERIEKCGEGVIEGAFRFRREDGNYWWAIASVMLLPGSGGKEYVYCVKPILKDSIETLLQHGASSRESIDTDEASLLWYNFVWGSTVKFFWKDMDRRFKGVSKAFLEYFGLSSEDEIIGKKGEDMNWHIDEDTYISGELDILNRGARISNAPGQCIINGIVHNTVSSKLPVYSNGRIVGLMGYLVDSTDELKRVMTDPVPANIDIVTGVMNSRAFADSIINYSVRYNEYGKNYGLILIKSMKHGRIVASYGKDFGDSVLQTIADKIVGIAGEDSVIARTKDAYFAVMRYADTKEELEQMANELKKAIESIISVQGNSVTLKAATAVRLRSEPGMFDENMYPSALNELMSL